MIIGYTQGTFDMFHIGHLNLLKNAKQHCNYLIVGVNTDELVRSYKKKNAIIPLDERMAIIEAIKYVDEVIACDSLDKTEVWHKHHFDILMIGDDWKGNQRWAKTEQDMAALGVELIFLPYTRDTNSTLLREKLLQY